MASASLWLIVRYSARSAAPRSAAYGWGANGDYQISAVKVDPATPGLISAVSTRFALGAKSTCWLTPAGTVTCRGAGTVVTTPQGFTGVVDLVAGKHHACALFADQTVQCWGDNDRGQLGGGTPTEVGPRVVEAP